MVLCRISLLIPKVYLFYQFCFAPGSRIYRKLMTRQCYPTPCFRVVCLSAVWQPELGKHILALHGSKQPLTWAVASRSRPPGALASRHSTRCSGCQHEVQMYCFSSFLLPVEVTYLIAFVLVLIPLLPVILFHCVLLPEREPVN